MFFDWMAAHKAQFDDLQILQVYPNQWGTQYRLGGFKTFGEDMAGYSFEDRALRIIRLFHPSVIYVQQEAYFAVTRQMWNLRNEYLPEAAFCLFVWENLIPESYRDKGVRTIVEGADGIACGSSNAKRLLGREDAIIMPQVGLAADMFFPYNTSATRNYDLIFVGREAKQKGWEVIEKMIKEHPDLRLLRLSGTGYSDMPAFYNRAKVHISPVIDQKFWAEQHASYANLEALSCGLRVVTSRSAAIVEYLQDVPGVYFCEQNDLKSLYEQTSKSLADWKINDAGREWVLRNISYPIIAQKSFELWKHAREARKKR